MTYREEYERSRRPQAAELPASPVPERPRTTPPN